MMAMRKPILAFPLGVPIASAAARNTALAERARDGG